MVKCKRLLDFPLYLDVVLDHRIFIESIAEFHELQLGGLIRDFIFVGRVKRIPPKRFSQY